MVACPRELFIFWRLSCILSKLNGVRNELLLRFEVSFFFTLLSLYWLLLFCKNVCIFDYSYYLFFWKRLLWKLSLLDYYDKNVFAFWYLKGVLLVSELISFCHRFMLFNWSFCIRLCFIFSLKSILDVRICQCWALWNDLC